MQQMTKIKHTKRIFLSRIIILDRKYKIESDLEILIEKFDAEDYKLMQMSIEEHEVKITRFMTMKTMKVKDELCASLNEDNASNKKHKFRKKMLKIYRAFI